MYNGHADVTALIDVETGEIAGTYYYDAFGNILEQTGDVDNSITYAGYQYDEETDLYYLNARMYDPKIARFLQEDTYTGDINDPLSLNLYTYCANNPLLYYDPSGHFFESIINKIKDTVTGLLKKDKKEEDKSEGNVKKEKEQTSLGLADFKILQEKERAKIVKEGEKGNNTPGVTGKISTVQYNLNGNVTNIKAWEPTVPFKTNQPGQRSADAYKTIIDQFDVENNPRYEKRNGATYCNIFAWDVTLAMESEIPQRVNIKTQDSQHFPDVKESQEYDANGMAIWLRSHGVRHGWVKVSTEEAQTAANRGEPTVTVWYNQGGIGHFQVVRPIQGNDTFNANTGVYVAQAGSTNFNYGTASTVYGQGAALNKLEYYTHK